MVTKRFFLLVSLLVVPLTACAGNNDTQNSEIQLPNVVGMNLQAAQDCLQARGFWLLDDQPEYGEPRLQINDDNWTVTRQSPDPGMYSEDVDITLYSRKTGGFGQGSGSRNCP